MPDAGPSMIATYRVARHLIDHHQSALRGAAGLFWICVSLQ
ncbi:hypothetical protein ALP26_101947 [Pseudomonas savastanoi pv. glycinea]|uniref:Uncharacterized protein n=1 Tax=Pseudomonas savastanoi pv. glycinea TaxID=318 RepID=A0A3M5X6G2_PSESG|nr:hypothetical protein ALQ67_101983 [Pseudomonas savastanoi pv. glycinea]RMN12133.1 hypothetical protein ALQ66_101839 [Pseudomonas savastanoi pv. glycinea]RMO40129.1 hypothetical protein ALQ41_101540 [Pseudomonas savastanoi pv. glycinea]RMU78142.1 hypothetical protein ALP26_101947 [Pseudomonas savastanoi pv. glycinea]